MKNSIAWHKECLENLKFFAVIKREKAKEWAYEAAKTEADVTFLAAQIAQAEKLGKDGFDSERFMAKLDARKGLEKLWANRPQT